jgi:hypothetical protein
MAVFTRTNGIGHADGTLYSTANLSVVTCTKASGDWTYGIGGTAEAVAQELGPLMIEFDGNGFAAVIDGHHTDASDLARRIGEITGATETVTVSNTLLALAP